MKRTKTEWAAVLLLLLGAAFLGGLFLGRGAGQEMVLQLPEPGEMIAQTREMAEQPAQSPQQLDLNTATVEELVTLPGIGPVLAERIVAYREENGPFIAVEELLGVQGIGEKKLDEMKSYVIAGVTANQDQEVQK